MRDAQLLLTPVCHFKTDLQKLTTRNALETYAQIKDFRVNGLSLPINGAAMRQAGEHHKAAIGHLRNIGMALPARERSQFRGKAD